MSPDGGGVEFLEEKFLDAEELLVEIGLTLSDKDQFACGKQMDLPSR